MWSSKYKISTLYDFTKEAWCCSEYCLFLCLFISICTIYSACRYYTGADGRWNDFLSHWIIY